jgi:hypothetical protein
VQLLMANDELDVVHCTLRGTTRRITFKAWLAERAQAAQQQLLSESKAPGLFPRDPLMVTALVISGNTASGNFTTASVYGGCSLEDLVNSPP